MFEQIIFYVALCVLALALLRFVVAITNLLSPVYLPNAVSEVSTPVSVLIPARNEEKNLSLLLSDLQQQDYNNIEILIYDDRSQDRTADIVRHFAASDRRIRLLQGDELPQGWMGKTFACHNLSLQATGGYFLFLDADVRLKKSAITKIIYYATKHKLSLLSVFPQQEMQSLGEKAVVPLMNWILLSFLPLLFVRICRKYSFAAANGQCMLFDAPLYRQYWWHNLVAGSPVEDIRIMQIIKKMKKRNILQQHTATMLGNDDFSCRMYTNFREAIEGFAKNIHYFFFRSYPVMIIIIAILSLGFIPVCIALPAKLILLYVGLVLTIKICCSIKSRQSLLIHIFLHPVHLVTLCVTAICSVKRGVQRKIIWKGREYKI